MKKKYYKEIGGKTYYATPLEGSALIGDCWVSNPTDDMLLADGWQVYVAPEPTLDEVKASKVSEIMTYNESDAVNSFSVNGVEQGWLTPDKRVNYRQTVEAAKRKGLTTIPFLGYEIPVDTVLSAIDDLDIYAWKQTACCEACIAAVNALETKEAVEAYDYQSEFAKTEKCDFTIG